MTEKRGMFKNLCIFIAPLMLTGLLQLLYTASDLIVCGIFGSENSVGAISSTNAVVNLIVNLFMGFAVGANVLMSRCYGANDRQKGQRVVYTSMAIAAISGTMMGLFGVFCSRYILQWMGTHPNLISLSTDYLVIYFIGTPFTMIYNFASSLLRAVGDTRKPFIFLTVSGVANVLLNMLFVAVCDLDVPGVAIATSISQFLAAAMAVVYLIIKKDGFFTFSPKKLRIYKKETLELLRVGLPAGLQGSIFSLSNVLIQSSVNVLGAELGEALINGNGAASSLEGFVYTAMNSCAQAVVTFGSANYGAGKKRNIRTVILYVLALILIVWAVMSGCILLARKPLLGLYVQNNPDAVSWGEQRMFLVLGFYFMCGFMDTFAYALRSIGYSMLPTVISTVGACGFRILWIFAVFPFPYFHNLMWLMISYALSWLLTAGTHLAFFAVFYSRLNLSPPKSLSVP